MANVSFFRSGTADGVGLAFQAPGTVAWNLGGGYAGDRDNYWGYSARPYQANNTVVLEKVSANQDNNLNNSTDLVVTVISNAPGINGTLIRFAAIRVTP